MRYVIYFPANAEIRAAAAAAKLYYREARTDERRAREVAVRRKRGDKTRRLIIAPNNH